MMDLSTIERLAQSKGFSEAEKFRQALAALDSAVIRLGQESAKVSEKLSIRQAIRLPKIEAWARALADLLRIKGDIRLYRDSLIVGPAVLPNSQWQDIVDLANRVWAAQSDLKKALIEIQEDHGLISDVAGLLGSTLGKVLGEAGTAAGKAVGGLFSGLGAKSSIVIGAIVVLAVYVSARRL